MILPVEQGIVFVASPALSFVAGELMEWKVAGVALAAVAGDRYYSPVGWHASSPKCQSVVSTSGSQQQQ